MNTKRLTLTIVLLVLAAEAQPATSEPAATILKVGDSAPKFQTGKWVQGDPVKDFKKGRACIVEFWPRGAVRAACRFRT